MVDANSPQAAPHPAGPLHPEVRSDTQAASFWAIFYILLTMLLVAIVIHLGVAWFYYEHGQYENRVKESPYPLAPNPSTALPQNPRLEQVDRLANVETNNVDLRQGAREEVLDSYGKTPEKGFVHVPIEQAIHYLENRLPSRPEPPAAQQIRSGGLMDAGASNSGWVFKKGTP